MTKKDGLWKGSSWDDLQVEFKGNQGNHNRDVKVKCPACVELGKQHINDTPLRGRVTVRSVAPYS